MSYLVDTNVFINAINNSIYPVIKKCKDNNTEVAITETILKELEPGFYLEQEDATLREVYISVYNFAHGKLGEELIHIIKLDDIPGAKEELRKIRNRFYKWMTDPQYLRRLVDDGRLEISDIRKKCFKYKDLGECELIAVAKVSPPGKYVIVSDDKGEVCAHPYQNLFQDYAVPAGIIVENSKEWLNEIGMGK